MENKKRWAMITIFAIIVLNGAYFLFFQNGSGQSQEPDKDLFYAVLGKAEEFESLEMHGGQNGINNIYAGYSDGERVGYAFVVTKDGYRKPITMLVGIDSEGCVCGVEIVVQKETRGKGSLIEKKDFLRQFIGLDSGNLDVQAISGATVSSNAIEQGIKTALEAASALCGK